MAIAPNTPRPPHSLPEAQRIAHRLREELIEGAAEQDVAPVEHPGTPADQAQRLRELCAAAHPRMQESA